jgi:hypothetical protein
VDGTVYEFPGSISGRTYLLCQRMFAVALTAGQTQATTAEMTRDLLTELAPDVELLSNFQQTELETELLGEHREAVYRMSSDRIQHVVITLAAWHALGPDVAVTVWEAPGNRVAPNRADRRRGSRAVATSTPSRGSRNGSTSARPRTAASRGARS